MTPVFHRHGAEYLTTQEWGDFLRRDVRVGRVLGTEPLADARHLLAPLAGGGGQLRGGQKSGEQPNDGGLNETVTEPADYVLRLVATTPKTVADGQVVFAPDVLDALDFPRAFAHIPSRTGTGERILPLETAPGDAPLVGVTLAWSLPDSLSIGDERELVADLRGYIAETARLGLPTAFIVENPPAPAVAAHRATSLCALLRKVGGQRELRLLSRHGMFASRDVWRAVYCLGLTWGNMDLFHWSGGTDTSHFRVSSSGNPPYFLPERAAEGERVPGVVLEYDVPRSVDPVAVFDRMAVALSYLGATLSGRPVTRTGSELDADVLDAERDGLQEAVLALTNAGIAPGSGAAHRFF